tara:strand:- start:119 stop:298 length:180 start_codon:yes stop_codon:yes gene_type:complete
MTGKQIKSLRSICDRFEVEFDSNNFPEAGNLDGLPDGYVCGWVGTSIYIGCSPEGEISS